MVSVNVAAHVLIFMQNKTAKNTMKVECILIVLVLIDTEKTASSIQVEKDPIMVPNALSFTGNKVNPQKQVKIKKKIG